MGQEEGKPHSVQSASHGLGSVEAGKGPERKVILTVGLGGHLCLPWSSGLSLHQAGETGKLARVFSFFRTWWFQKITYRLAL